MNIKALILLVPLSLTSGCCDSSKRQAAVPSSEKHVNATATEGRFDAGHPVIVRMTGRANSLTISSSRRGLAYSVADRSGEPILSAGTMDDLKRVSPELARQVNTGVAAGESTTRGEFLDARVDLGMR